MVLNEPLNALPPDLVIALTMPPENRPNSADTPAVEIVVSCSASSMNSGSEVRRTLSCATTPFTRIRFSEVIAPDIAICWLPVFELLGPVRSAPGVSAIV